MGHHGGTVFFASFCLTGLTAFFLFLIPNVEFLEEILAGLITDLDSFILSIPNIAFLNLSNLFYLVESGAEVAVFNAYPLHWTLAYRPEDAWAVALQIIPWLASGAIIGALFPDNPKDALIIGIGTILSASMLMATLYIIIPLAILPNIPVIGPVLVGVLSGMSAGFTDLPMGVSAVLTMVEGGGIFTAMVLFMSTLKSNERPSPTSTRGATTGLNLATIGAMLTGFLIIPGFIISLVNLSKNPGDRKAIAGTIIGAMGMVIIVMIIFIFVPAPH
jgi:hypothetical protein